MVNHSSQVSRIFPYEPKTFQCGQHAMSYVDAGSGPSVVMVHGNPSWSFLYRGLIAELSPRYRCFAPDHIGCGRSDKPSKSVYSYTLAQRIADLGRFIDAVVPEGPIDLIVHDWGGMIGFGWAVQHVERIRSLTVMNTAAFGLPPDAKVPPSLHLARIPVVGALLVRGLNAFVRGANVSCVTRRPLTQDIAAGFAAPYDSWAHRVAVHEFVRDIPLSPSHVSWATVKQVEAALVGLRHVPMLLCWGMRDFVFDAAFLDEWLRRFPSAEVHRFAESGHYLLEDAGEEVAALVRKFLEGRQSASLSTSVPSVRDTRTDAS